MGAALGLAALTAIGTSHGADELGSVARLTNGFQAEFIGSALIAAVGALGAAAFVRSHPAGPAEASAAEEATDERELVAV